MGLAMAYVANVSKFNFSPVSGAIQLRRYQAYTLAPFTGTLVSLFQEIQIKMMPRGYFKS